MTRGMVTVQRKLNGIRFGNARRKPNPELATRLDRLLRDSGLQGVPALSYALGLACWRLKQGDAPTPPKDLDSYELRFIDHRVNELLDLNGRPLP